MTTIQQALLCFILTTGLNVFGQMDEVQTIQFPLGDDFEMDLNLSVNEWLSISLQQQNYDITTVLYYEDDSITTFDKVTPNGLGNETIQFTAKGTGKHSLLLKVLNPPDTSDTVVVEFQLTARLSESEYKQQQALLMKQLDPLVIAGNDPIPWDKFESDFTGLKVLAAGEATHGSKDFFVRKVELFKYLVKNHGFKTLALEASFANCLYLNRYVQTGIGDIDTAMSLIGYGVWRNESLKALVQWMQKENEIRSKNEKLRLVGVDVQYTYLLLHEMEPDMETWMVEKKEYFVNLIANIVEAGPTSEARLLQKEFMDRLPAYLSLLDSITTSKVQHVSMPLLTRAKCLELLKNEFNGDRDRNMADMIRWELENYPTHNVFFWAHNGHVLSQSLDIEGELLGSTGYWLQHYFGQEYKSIGFDFGSGGFMVSPTAKQRKAKGTSKVMHQTNIVDHTHVGMHHYLPNKLNAGYILNLGKAKAKMKFQEEELFRSQVMYFRSIGNVSSNNPNVYNDNTNWFFDASTLWDLGYDFLIYLTAVEPSTILPPKQIDLRNRSLISRKWYN